eukprot:NODE_76_length_23837_cov_1.242396.p23 type:complete len:104 gc:universal NODE_76_length_23837_cov_1.242396:5820-5509(-)
MLNSAKQIVAKYQAKLWEHAYPSVGRSGLNVLRKPLIGEKLVQWYPKTVKPALQRKLNKAMGIEDADLAEVERKAKLKMRAARGKSAPPKKIPGTKTAKKSKK